MDAREIKVPAGTIRYREAGTGPAIVFVHGYLVDGRLWDGVAEALADRFHVVVPDLPFGAHKVPTAPDAALDPPGMATIVDDFIAALGLDDVALVGNDAGGAVPAASTSASRSPPRRPCAAPASPSCSSGRRAIATFRWQAPNASAPMSAARNSCRYPTRRPSYRSISRK
jgi:hypothetical protein